MFAFEISPAFWYFYSMPLIILIVYFIYYAFTWLPKHVSELSSIFILNLSTIFYIITTVHVDCLHKKCLESYVTFWRSVIPQTCIGINYLRKMSQTVAPTYLSCTSYKPQFQYNWIMYWYNSLTGICNNFCQKYLFGEPLLTIFRTSFLSGEPMTFIWLRIMFDFSLDSLVISDNNFKYIYYWPQ